MICCKRSGTLVNTKLFGCWNLVFLLKSTSGFASTASRRHSNGIFQRVSIRLPFIEGKSSPWQSPLLVFNQLLLNRYLIIALVPNRQLNEPLPRNNRSEVIPLNALKFRSTIWSTQESSQAVSLRSSVERRYIYTSSISSQNVNRQTEKAVAHKFWSFLVQRCGKKEQMRAKVPLPTNESGIQIIITIDCPNFSVNTSETEKLFREKHWKCRPRIIRNSTTPPPLLRSSAIIANNAKPFSKRGPY